MFEMIRVTGSKHDTRVRNLSLHVGDGETRALLCPSITLLNEFVDILQNPENIALGTLLLNGRSLFERHSLDKSKFVLNDEQMFRSLSVVDNIFVNDRRLLFARRKRRIAGLEAKMAGIGYTLDLGKRPISLTTEQKKMVEILRCYYSEPDLLILYETVNKISYRVLSSLLLLLKEMKRRGATILFLTSQWEDAVKIADRITIVSNSKNCGTFDTEEVKKDPAKIYPLMLGSDSFEERNSRRISLVKKISDSISFISSGFDLNNVMSIYAKSVATDLKAENCLVYLVDEKDRTISEVSGHYRERERLPLLDKPLLMELVDVEDFFFFNSQDSARREYFRNNSRVKTVMGFSVKLPNRISILVQVYYYQRYIYSQKDIVYLSLVAREIAIIIENSHLIGKSFLLQESHHRIKNNLQFIISLLQLQQTVIPESGLDRRAAAAMLDGIIGRIGSVAGMHDILSRDNVANSYVDIADIITEFHKFYQKDAHINLNVEKFFIPFGKMTSIGLVINELVSNTVKYSGLPPGERAEIDIAIRKADDSYLLSYRDNGRGVEEGFDYEGTAGIGGMIIRSIVQGEFHGTLSFEPGPGFRLNILLPVNFITQERKK